MVKIRNICAVTLILYKMFHLFDYIFLLLIVILISSIFKLVEMNILGIAIDLYLFLLRHGIVRFTYLTMYCKFLFILLTKSIISHSATLTVASSANIGIASWQTEETMLLIYKIHNGAQFFGQPLINFFLV